VTVHVTVQEAREKASLNSPGGAELMEKVGGKGQGLPFIAFLDSQGAVIANSMRPQAGNIGHPYKPEEVDWFMVMLRKAAPEIAPSDSEALEQYLRKQEP